MTSRISQFGVGFTLLLASLAPGAAADDESGRPVYSDKGADACLMCHQTPEVAMIFQSAHGSAGDLRGPFGQHQCESCHGALGENLPLHGDAVISFGSDAKTSVEDQNGMCLDCHQQTAGHWNNSTHAAEDLGCVDCHKVHVENDSMFSVTGQPDGCYGCHLKERGQMARPYAHPVRYGKMNCSTCHDAHGSSAEFALNRVNINETCYGCHAEKRGPFTFEHAPAAEDCSLCHQAHGSIHASMLTKTAHLLCQQCHSQGGHPAVRYTSDGLSSDSPSSFVLAGRCMNCHSQVHGSNHPSGITQTK